MIILLIFAAFILTGIGGLIYLYRRVQRFFPESMPRKKKRLLAVLPIVGLLIWCALDFVNGVIVIVNILAIWLLCDLAAWLIRKLRGAKKAEPEAEKAKTPIQPEAGQKRRSVYWAGICAIAISVIYLGTGWYFAHHVVATNYALTTEKDLPGKTLRIVQIADSHLGATFDGKKFADYVKKMEKEKPDMLVITGDFVDDDSNRADLEKACEALGKMQTTYGVFYVYGNHDKGYMNSRDFTDADMRQIFAKNNIRILEDEVVSLDGKINLIGRKDRSAGQRGMKPDNAKQGDSERLDMEALAATTDEKHYRIVLDHQPHDFENQAKTGVDLVLCGHTHGGQMFPVGVTGELSGANDKTYGLEKRENTNFIVTSGISDWAIKFKTGGAISEYVVIDIAGKK